MPGVVARRPNEPFASSVAMLMKPPTAVAVGHHKTDPKANFTNNFKNLKKLFPTAQTQIFGHCGEKLLHGVEYAFWMTWYRIPLDTLGAQCCGKWRMQEGVRVRVCGTGGNVAEGGCCVPTIGKWPTINVRMLWGIKLLKNVEGGERRWRVRADTKETDGKQMIMRGYNTCTGAAACLWIYNQRFACGRTRKGKGRKKRIQVSCCYSIYILVTPLRQTGTLPS